MWLVGTVREPASQPVSQPVGRPAGPSCKPKVWLRLGASSKWRARSCSHLKAMITRMASPLADVWREKYGPLNLATLARARPGTAKTPAVGSPILGPLETRKCVGRGPPPCKRPKPANLVDYFPGGPLAGWLSPAAANSARPHVNTGHSPRAKPAIASQPARPAQSDGHNRNAPRQRVLI